MANDEISPVHEKRVLSEFMGNWCTSRHGGLM